MITVHILEANLKALPGKIPLLVTETLTHSLPLPPWVAGSTHTPAGGQGDTSHPAMHSQSSAQQGDGH